MVGMARPVEEGGIGFDYRLAMGVPDNWIKLLKEKSDEQWSLAELYQTLLNRRWSEACSESYVPVPNGCMNVVVAVRPHL